jgi:type II secretory pathway pseudopilin PulG
MRPPARRKKLRGFTMIEATITLAILMIGILGMGALASATIRQNMDAHDITQAANLAEQVAAKLKMESAGWSQPTWDTVSDVPTPAKHMPLLSRPDFSKAADAPMRELTQFLGPTSAFDQNLNLVAPNADEARYCVHYALSWIEDQETIRADIRVYWLRRGSPDPDGLRTNCGTGNETNLAQNTTDVRTYSLPVYLSRTFQGD